jgi:hypothetical protein
MTKFTFVGSECGDWEALYIDGKIAAEGHSVSAIDVLDAIADILPNEVEIHGIPDEVAEGGMPKSLSDLSDYLL